MRPSSAFGAAFAFRASSACLGPGHCATTFAGPLGIGASFNRSSWVAKGGVLAVAELHGRYEQLKDEAATDQSEDEGADAPSKR